MRLQLVTARQGIVWVRRGFQIFARQPLGFSMLFAAFVFAMAVLSLLPLLGPLLLLALLPLVSLWFMIATRAALAGGFATPTALARSLRADPARVRGLLQLGLIYAVASVSIMGLADLIDGGTLDQLMERLSDSKSSADDVAELLSDGRLQAGLVVRAALAAALSVPFWHAPALVHWDGQRCAQSLFSSCIAVWRNRGAFTWYVFAWTALALGFALFANVIFLLLGMPQLITLAALPVSLIFSTVFYASLYFTFADCFELPDGGAALAPPRPMDTP